MKKITLIILALILCFGLCACGSSNVESDGTTNKDYEKAIGDLRFLLENSFTESELHSQQYLPYLDNSLETPKRPLFSDQESLVNLYHQFTELGDYKQAKEIADRFSVVEKGYVSISETYVDAFQQEHINEDFKGYLLDAKGRQIWESFGMDGRGGSIWVYDENGNQIREIANILHKYNEQGLLIETTDVGSEGIYTITTYSYDEHGKCTNQESKCADGSTYIITYTYVYDEQGNCTEKVCHEPSGDTETTTYWYDEEGNCLFEFGRYADGVNIGYDVKIYSKSGNLIYFTDAGLSGGKFDTLEDAKVTDYQYQDGLPVSVTFANGITFIFNYTPAYYFDAEGLVLSEE